MKASGKCVKLRYLSKSGFGSRLGREFDEVKSRGKRVILDVRAFLRELIREFQSLG